MDEAGVAMSKVAGHEVAHTRREGAELVMLARLAGPGGGLWDALWPHLARAHAVAAVALRAPDTTAEPREMFGALADDLIAVATALGHPRFHLVGWNGGAHMALAAATLRPGALITMTLMAPFRAVGERRQIAAGLDVLEALLRAGDRATYARHWFMAGFSDHYLQTHFDAIEALVTRRLANDRFLTLDTDRAMRWMRALREDHVTDDELSAIALPSLILAPGLNRWHAGPDRRMAEAIAERIAGSTLHVFDGMGAFFPIEAAAETARRILAHTARPADG